MPLSKQGKKPAWEIRNAIEDFPHFEPEEITALAKEAEAIFNAQVEQGKPPSELFERLVLNLQMEAGVSNHPDRDMDARCSACDRR